MIASARRQFPSIPLQISVMSREFPAQAPFFRVDLGHPFLGLNASLSHDFGDELRVVADHLDLSDDESFDLTGRDGGGRTGLPSSFLGRKTNIVAVSFVAAPGTMRR